MRCQRLILAGVVGASFGCGPKLGAGEPESDNATEAVGTGSTTEQPATSPPETSSPATGSPATGSPATSSPVTSSPDSDSPPEATTSSSPETSGSTTQSEDTDGETTAESAGFIPVPDYGNKSYQCDEWAQDCPPGEKCTVWANDGGNAISATKCVPVVDDPVAYGESCAYEGATLSGHDNCDIGSFCWNLDSETGEGTCIAFCVGSWADPFCSAPDHSCSASSSLAVCLPNCDPLLQDCAAGEGCYGIASGYVCAPDASGDGGNFGEPCEFINGCSAGLECLGAGAGLDCEGGSCCTAFCDATEDEPCPAEYSCVRVHEPGDAPVGQENYGYCVVEE